MVKASSAAASQLTSTPSVITDSTESTSPKASASSGRMRPAGIGRLARARHQRVDVGVVPHVERAGRAGADGDRQDGDERDEGIGGDRCGDQADERREHDQRHHARLQQREIVGRRRLREVKAGVLDQVLFDQRHLSPFCLAKPPVARRPAIGISCGAYLIFGSCSHWWNGGGEGSCHSSVVAPSPHGLAPATRFFENASNTP